MVRAFSFSCFVVCCFVVCAAGAADDALVLPQDHWRTDGFVELVPTVRLPTDGDGDDHIAVWLKLPDGGVIDVDEAGLVFPAGTVADRVESVVVDGVRTVVDVRGSTVLGKGRQRFHVYVPSDLTPGGPLRGFAWRSDDAAASARATTALATFLSTTPQLQAGGHHATATSTRQLVDRYVQNNRCLDCHTAGRDETLREDISPRRATDAQGWFVPLAVLDDVQPLDQARPRDTNVGSFVDVRCPAAGGKAQRETGTDGAARWRCAEGAPLVHFDVAAAVKAGDDHAERVCASRRFFFTHMTMKARTRYADAFRACGIP